MKKTLRALIRRPKSQSTSSTSTSSTSITSSSPGDQLTPLPLGYKITPLEVRDLNELIRKRYTLDIRIWNLRHCRPRDRPVVEDIMRKSDAALLKIQETMRLWDRPDLWEYPADWQRLQAIKRKLGEGEQRFWAENPPFENSSGGEFD